MGDGVRVQRSREASGTPDQSQGGVRHACAAMVDQPTGACHVDSTTQAVESRLATWTALAGEREEGAHALLSWTNRWVTRGQATFDQRMRE